MKPPADFLAACGRRILAVVPRGVPRRAAQVDELAAECGIVIGSLCQTTEDAERLTAHLVQNPPPRWNFPDFQQRAQKFMGPAEPERPTIEQEQAREEQEFRARLDQARETFRQLSPHHQAEQLERRRRDLEARYGIDNEAWINPPAGANFRIRTLLQMREPQFSELLEGLVILDIMTGRENDLAASPKIPASSKPKALKPARAVMQKMKACKTKKP